MVVQMFSLLLCCCCCCGADISRYRLMVFINNIPAAAAGRAPGSFGVGRTPNRRFIYGGALMASRLHNSSAINPFRSAGSAVISAIFPDPGAGERWPGEEKEIFDLPPRAVTDSEDPTANTVP